jgi:uncharacterized membrane protein YecN with MAPEG domain
MISMMYAGLCTLLVIFLALRVVKWRKEHKIGLGHGDNIELQRRVRAHANATENMPLALILLGSMELSGLWPALIHILGAVFFLSRVAHAWGVSHSHGYSKGRFWGMAFTWLPMILMAVIAITESIFSQIPKAY